LSRAAPETLCVVSIGEFNEILFAIPVQDAPAVMRALSGAVQIERDYVSLKYEEEFQIKREYLPIQIKRVKASAIRRMPASTTSPAKEAVQTIRSSVSPQIATPLPGETP